MHETKENGVLILTILYTTTTTLYLRVKHSVCVIPVGRSLVQPVVAASRVVHVHVPYAQGQRRCEASEAQNSFHRLHLSKRESARKLLCNKKTKVGV